MGRYLAIGLLYRVSINKPCPTNYLEQYFGPEIWSYCEEDGETYLTLNETVTPAEIMKIREEIYDACNFCLDEKYEKELEELSKTLPLKAFLDIPKEKRFYSFQDDYLTLRCGKYHFRANYAIVLLGDFKLLPEDVSSIPKIYERAFYIVLRHNRLSRLIITHITD